MAKIKYSALVSEIRGKLNGSVASRNRGGNYLRNKVTPINPATTFQVAARNLLTQFAQSWRGLTEDQRKAFNNAVENFKKTDIFGDLKTPTGENLYVRLNVNISLVGGTPITTPPLPAEVEALSSLTLSATAPATVAIAFTPTPVPADHHIFVEGTAGKSAGVSNFNSFFRQVTTIDPAATSPAAIGTEYQSKFGDLVAGQKIAARCKMIQESTGLVSLALKDTAIVA